MTRYPKYKQTGISWLPEIPTEWEMATLRRFLKIVSEKGFPEKTLLSVTRERGVIVRNVESKEENHNFIPDDLSGYKLVRKGDFAINKMKSWQGSYGVSEYEGIVSPAYYICKLENVDKDFFSRAIRSKTYVSFFAQYSKGIRVDQWDLSPIALRSIPFALPSLKVQQSIVAFLDDKCGKIDKVVAAKENEIELLNELKQTEIADAVTRGIAGAPLVASGIPWLPMIPKGWEVKKVKQLVDEGKEKNKGNVEKTVLSLSYGRIIKKKDVYSGLVPADFATYQIVNPGYVVMRLTDLQNDHKSLRCGLVKDRGIITSAYVSLIPKHITPEYLYLILHACDLHKVFYSMGDGLRQSMNFADVGNLLIPVPSRAEQVKIAKCVEDKVLKFDAAVKGLEEEVAALKEYKQRLISDVVTGQVKV